MSNNSVLRNQVKEHLLLQIQNGELQIGRTINLAALSRLIGVSVTPIREALSQLEHVRVVKAIPNRGFVVASLSANEAKDIIETIGQLEVMALENSVFKEKDVKILRSLQSKMEQAENITEGLNIRFRFHSYLMHKCRNRVLLEILENLKLRLHFYEHNLIKDLGHIEKICNQANAIVAAIEENNLPTAALILKMDWMGVLDYIENQMQVKKG